MLCFCGAMDWMRGLLVLALILGEATSRPADTKEGEVLSYDFEDGEFSTLIPEDYPGPVTWKIMKYKDLDTELGGKAPRPISGGGENFIRLDLSRGVSSGSFFKTPIFEVTNGANVSFDYYISSAIPESSGIQVYYLGGGSAYQKPIMELYKSVNKFMTASALIPAGTSGSVQIWVYGNGNVEKGKDVVAIDNVRISLINDTTTTQATSTTNPGTSASKTSDPLTPSTGKSSEATKDGNISDTTADGEQTSLHSSSYSFETTVRTKTSMPPSAQTEMTGETKEDTQTQPAETTYVGSKSTIVKRDTTGTEGITGMSTHATEDVSLTTNNAFTSESVEPKTTGKAATETSIPTATNEESGTGTGEHSQTTRQSAASTAQEAVTTSGGNSVSGSVTPSEVHTTAEEISTTETEKDPASYSTESDKTSPKTDSSQSSTTMSVATEEQASGTPPVVTYPNPEGTSASPSGTMRPLTTEEQGQGTTSGGTNDSSKPTEEQTSGTSESNVNTRTSSATEGLTSSVGNESTVATGVTKDTTLTEEASETTEPNPKETSASPSGTMTTEKQGQKSSTADEDKSTTEEKRSTTREEGTPTETTGDDFSSASTASAESTADVKTNSPPSESSTTTSTDVTEGSETLITTTERGVNESTVVPSSTPDQRTTEGCTNIDGSTSSTIYGNVQIAFYTIVRIKYPNGEEEMLVFHNQNTDNTLPVASDISNKLIKILDETEKKPLIKKV